MAIADLVKTTLGPKGMDIILQSTGRGHSVTVTNDGAVYVIVKRKLVIASSFILRFGVSLCKLDVVAKGACVLEVSSKKGFLIDISKVQDDEVGDGTTSEVVIAGELLREAEKLV
ncbi:hypothetical protein Ccrd_002868, partial [Cynara cardunculus var. scolymus]